MISRARHPHPSPKTSSPSSSKTPVTSAPFSVLSLHISADGDEVHIQFPDQRFTFLTWWLYLSRKSEGLPSPDGCKNPPRIRIRCLETSGMGIRTTVDIAWNTGTTSQFPALLLRVLGPTKALEQERRERELPVASGKNPRSGVEQLTLDEKRVADRYQALLMETMREYMDEEWLFETPTSLLREMVRYVEVELQRESSSAQAPAGEAAQNDATAGSSSDESLIDEEVIK